MIFFVFAFNVKDSENYETFPTRLQSGLIDKLFAVENNRAALFLRNYMSIVFTNINPLLHEFFLGYALFVYRLIVVALIENLFDDPFCN